MEALPAAAGSGRENLLMGNTALSRFLFRVPSLCHSARCSNISLDLKPPGLFFKVPSELISDKIFFSGFR